MRLPQHNDDLFKWRLKLRGFDDDVPGGRKLNEDLRRLERDFGQDHLLMEAAFPADYPTRPVFLRLLSPRCVMYTGHVTAGGSICIGADLNRWWTERRGSAAMHCWKLEM